MATCIKCGKVITDNAIKCRYCFAEQVPDFNKMDMIVTSAPSIEGYEIIEQCGFIYGEIVCPNGILGALTNGTFFTISALTDAREKAINALKSRARSLEANAIIALDIDISDLNGNGVLVSANGTAVFCIPSDYANKHEEFVQLQLETKQRIAQENQLRNQRIEGQMKAMADTDISQIDKTILKLIIKYDNSTAMSIMKMLPKNIAPNDVSASLNKMLEQGIIEKSENGIYKSNLKIDD